jgi:hypothetical protein
VSLLQVKAPFKRNFRLVMLLVLLMFLLHNSFWLWQYDGSFPLLFGFMPFAFSFYVVYALLAVAVLGLIVRLAWPDPPADLFDGDEREEETER